MMHTTRPKDKFETYGNDANVMLKIDRGEMKRFIALKVYSDFADPIHTEL